MALEPVNTPSAPAAIGPYSPAVRAGEWIVLSGQIPLDPKTGTLVCGDIETQTRQVMTNIAAILGDCGATLHDVAKTTIFVTDLDDFPTVNAAYADALGDHRPARATVQVAALPAGAGVEIEVWAYNPET
jgi:2-iminobutanoate/2-iminopropanoate deaminase